MTTTTRPSVDVIAHQTVDMPPMVQIGVPEPPPQIAPVTFYLFDQTTGDYQYQTVLCEPNFVGNCTPPDMVAVPDVENAHAKRLVQGQLIDAPQPPQPDADHEWDDQNKRWRLSLAAQRRDSAKAQARADIVRLETASLRAIREWLLTGDTAAFHRLKQIDDTIVGSRKQIR